MAELPSDALLHIFSRLPVKSLAHFRSVCKLWCKYIDDPYLAIIHDKLALEEPMLLMNKGVNCDKMPLIHKINYQNKQSFWMRFFNVLSYEPHIDLEVRNSQILKKFYNTYRPIDRFRGSCKGLLLLGSRQDYTSSNTNFVVFHPLRKELYELPPLKHRQDLYSSSYNKLFCGLGFDTSTNTFKVVCVEPSENALLPLEYELDKEDLRTMVHVLGTNTWKGTPNVSNHCWTEPGVFVNGGLHWLVTYTTLITEVISFDVTSEEFGFIDAPKEKGGGHDHLVDLCGDLGYLYQTRNLIEVWALKKNKEWVMHCRFQNERRVLLIVLGCWNKDGDILLTIEGGKNQLFVYNLKSGTLKIAGRIDGYVEDVQMYRGSLFSIDGVLIP